jgi:putative addiction module component (TIGR02574 family)
MSPNVKKILEEAMQLEPGKRALIAETLLESLDFEENFEISQAWRDEVERRCAQIDHGTVELIDSDTAMAELRKKHG